VLVVDLKAELEALEAEKKRAKSRPLPWALRGTDKVLFQNLTSATLADPVSEQGLLDLENFNAVRLWVLNQRPGTLTFYVETAFSRAGPWFVHVNPADPVNQYFTASSSLALDVVTGARFVRVRPTSVTGAWSVIATPYVFGAGYVPAPTVVRTDDGYRENRVFADGVGVDTTGVKLTYTVPAGRRAWVTYAAWSANGGTVALEVLPAGATNPVVLTSGTNINQSLNLTLTAGDAVRFRVTVAGTAGQTGSGIITVLESP
jgi:hypothetical protein